MTEPKGEGVARKKLRSDVDSRFETDYSVELETKPLTDK
jgi:hypothetical protein